MPNFVELNKFLDRKYDETEKKYISGRELCIPWTDLRQFPEFSYQTSYKTAFPVNYVYEKILEPPEKEEPARLEPKYKYELFKNQYKTNYEDAYVYNLMKGETGEKPSFISYLDTLRETLRLREICKPSLLSEYTKNYQMHIYDSSICGVIKDQEDETRFEGPTLIKRIHPSFDPNAGGAKKEKDIYISSTHYTHGYIPLNKVVKANEPVTTKLKKLRVYTDPHPIDPFLKLPFRQVNLLEKTHTVPHRGMLSEFQEKYKPQVDIFHKKGLEFDMSPDKLKFKDTEDMIKKMDMFHTEYDHLGHNWSTQNV